MQVLKRNSNKEFVKFDKITERLKHLLNNDLSKIIDPVIITQKIATRIHDGITTSEIDELSSNICISMITVHPAYGKLAGRIVIDNHQKNTSPNFLHVIKILRANLGSNGKSSPLASKELEKIAEKHEQKIQNMLDFSRDHDLGYFGFKTLEKAYLKKVGSKIVERPQHLFMRVAIGIHGEDLDNIKETYDYLSLKYYTHATPTLFHAGTPRPQMSSCFLLDGSEDSVEGIYKSITNCALISKWAGGIGVHISGIRGSGSYINKTGGKSNGLMPMLKVYNDTARYINQSGKRPGSFAMYIEPWHCDIFSFLDAKKNHGQEEERARDLFYALWIPDLFMERVSDDKDWTLMCPNEYPGLDDVYGDEFKTLYELYESKEKTVNRKHTRTIKARYLWKAIISSQVETGTPYMLYKDSCNKKSNQKNLGTIKSSNLCAEIIEYSTYNNKNGLPEAAVCNLASLCLPKILKDPDLSIFENKKITIYSKDNCGWCKLAKGTMKKLNIQYNEILLNNDTIEDFFNEYNVSTVPQIIIGEENIGGYDNLWKLVKPIIDFELLIKLAKSTTYNLNKIIDKNFYPIESTRLSNMTHRPIGIGVQGLADLFIKLRLPFTSEEAKEVNLKVFEAIYFGSLQASLDLAKKHGPYDSFEDSPLSKGKFQFDLWEKDKNYLSGLFDWESLRTDIIKYGVRNSLLIALMPTASTSQIMGNNECIEPYTSNIYKRRTLAGEFTIINEHLMEDLISMGMWDDEARSKLLYLRGSVQQLPNFPSLLKNVYKTVWEISQKECIRMTADRSRFVCQSQSFNLWFDNPTFKTLTNAHMFGWKQGLKTGSYYIRSKPKLNSQRFTMDPNKEKEYDECLNCGS
jgi:ribonucleoside-diphosphate reductase alpha subunit